ncbi:MAG: peptide-methionine (S)-S-oxide reductase MsrA [Candidatus Dormibacteraeota bacterium]|uniref:Peptide methionine sulfoxide reductase MsrA n=1 Tax=Candidatus Amunia macphersoniae TaxID=3127014 RepID=A0A934KK77_9BACT|nr:peptide-methionine (S)-S-oxide reductase MsrA [Candidatus Dormibacteraeota bacterium]
MFSFLSSHKTKSVSAVDALPGRPEPIEVSGVHRVSGRSMTPPYPDGMETAVFGMGCFWGAERLFWQLDGVWVTAVGYAGGFTQNPTYEQVCSARTGHAEVVLVVYDPGKISYDTLLSTFWAEHDPTQGMRQGNDVGTQYRSLIGTFGQDQVAAVELSRAMYQRRLTAAGKGQISTEVAEEPVFYFAEPYHQQYLDANPGGYCGLKGTGVSCPIGTGVG